MIFPQWYTDFVRIFEIAWMSAWYVVFLVVASLTAIMIVIRRNKQPLRSRTPGLLLLQLAFSAILVTLFTEDIVFMDFSPCLVFIAYFTFGLPLIFTPYFLRCWKLYFAFKLQETSSAMLNSACLISKIPNAPDSQQQIVEPEELSTDLPKSGENENNNENESPTVRVCSSTRRFHNWYRNLLSAMTITLVGVGFVLAHVVYFLVVCIVFILDLGSPNLFQTCQVPVAIAVIVVILETCVYVTLVAATAVFMRKIRDEFNISKELYVSMAVISCSFLSLGVIGLGQFWIDHENQQITSLGGLMVGLVIDIFVYGIVPVVNTFVWEMRLRRTRRQQQLKEGQSPSFADLDLHTFIRDRECFMCLEEYCKAELSVENLYAFREIQDYRLIANNEAKAQAKALEIYRTFVSESAPLQVNIRRVQRMVIRAAVYPKSVPSPAVAVTEDSHDIESPIRTREPSGAFEHTQQKQQQQQQITTDKPHSRHSQDSARVCDPVDWLHLFDDIEREILRTMSDTLMRFLESQCFQKFLKKKRAKKVAHHLVV